MYMFDRSGNLGLQLFFTLVHTIKKKEMLSKGRERGGKEEREERELTEKVRYVNLCCGVRLGGVVT